MKKKTGITRPRCWSRHRSLDGNRYGFVGPPDLPPNWAKITTVFLLEHNRTLKHEFLKIHESKLKFKKVCKVLNKLKKLLN